MTEEEHAAAIQREGEITIAAEGTAEETAADSQSEEENLDGKTQSDEGENTQDEDKLPFHKQKRWIERESEWNTRFNEQETRHQNDLKAIREEFGEKRKDNAEQTKIPAWFGGTQEQWDAYRADRDAELEAAGTRAIEKANKESETTKKAQEDAVKEATEFMRTEIAAIEGDKTLNPSGTKIDPEKLLKTVLENELIDAKGRWNYRAGWRILRNESASSQETIKENLEEKKKIADISTKGNKGDNKAPNVTTSADFKKEKPW